MSAATIITNATPGAPVLNGTEGSLSALFRYLAPILGWSIEFDNGPVIVVKPQSYKGGQALFYRIDDRAARGGLAPRTAEVKAYESMSDINTGAGLVGTTYIQKSYTANTAANVYELCGDAYGFYLKTCKVFFEDTPSLSRVLSYLGFSTPMRAADIPICVLLGASDTTSTATTYAIACAVVRDASIASTSNCFIHRNNAGTLGTPAALIANGGPHPVNKCPCFNSVTMPSYDGTLLYAQPYLNDGQAYSIRAYLPGLYYPCNLYSNIRDLYIDLYRDNNIQVDGKVFKSAFIESQVPEYGWGYVLLDVGEGFRS